MSKIQKSPKTNRQDIKIIPSSKPKRHSRPNSPKTPRSPYKIHSAEDKRRKTRFIIFIITIVTLFIALPVTFFLIDLQKTATVNILLAPSFAKVEINGKTYDSGTERINAYSGKVTVSADGFQSKELDVNLASREITDLYVYLVPNDGNMNWYDERPAERQILSAIGDSFAIIQSENFHTAHPIIDILPISVAEVDPKTQTILHDYRIDYGEFTGCETDFCLKITDHTGKDHENALQYLRDRGYNPEDYQILYQNDSMALTSPRAENN